MPYLSHTITEQRLLPVALFTGNNGVEGHNLFTVRYRFTQDMAGGDFVELLRLTRNDKNILKKLDSAIVARIEDFCLIKFKGE